MTDEPSVVGIDKGALIDSKVGCPCPDEPKSIYLNSEESLSNFRCCHCGLRYVPEMAVRDADDWAICPHCGEFTGL